MRIKMRLLAALLTMAFVLGACTAGSTGGDLSNESAHTHEASKGSNSSSGEGPKITEISSDPLTIQQGVYDKSLEEVTAKDGAKWYKGKASFYGTFDTIITVITYTEEEKQFDEYVGMIREEYQRLHRLYDNYNKYDGVNNVMTLNEEAAKGPVKVDKDLLDIVVFSQKHFQEALGKTNIGMGSVLRLWHDARDAAGEYMSGLPNGESEWTDPDSNVTFTAKLPEMAALQEANKYTNVFDIVADENNSTIFYKNDKVKMDVGAVAKGYATEVVAQKLEKAGLKSALISAGGNVRSIGIPQDGRDAWGVGVQNPRRDTNDPNSSITSEVLYIGADTSVVTSGDYQRFYTVDGKKYHHLIDPVTLMPGTMHSSVTVVVKDSGMADYLSTAFFLANAEETKQLLDNFKALDVGVIWIDDAGNVTSTDNMKPLQGSLRD